MHKLEILKRKLPVFIIILTLTLSIILMIPSVLFAQEEATTEEVVEPEPESLLLETTLPKLQAKDMETFTFSFDVAYTPGDNPFGIEEDENEKTFDVVVTYPDGWVAG